MTRFQIVKDDLSRKQLNSLMALQNDEQWQDWDICEDADYVIGETALEGSDAEKLLNHLVDEFGIADSYIEIE